MWRLTFDLRWLAHEGPPAHPASPGGHDREGVRPRWRASGDRGESHTQAATDRPAPSSQAGAKFGAERPADLRTGVAFPQFRTHPKGRHRRTPLDAPGIHQALVRRKYHRLFSSPVPEEAGPTGPSEALIQAIVELKSRNPRFGCPRIARIVSHTFGVDIDKNVVYRVLLKHHRPAPGGTGPSWLSFIGHTTDSLWSVDLFRCESIVLRSYWVLVVMDQFTRRLVGVAAHRGPVSAADFCRMFNAAIHERGTPRYLSTDHDPLFEAHRWTANLRILEIDEIKTVPLVPLSHPFVERLVGTMRREFLDHVLFWNAGDLERKLADFQTYYNAARGHAALEGHTPLTFAGGRTQVRAELNNVRWVSHCRDLVQLPEAA